MDKKVNPEKCSIKRILFLVLICFASILVIFFGSGVFDSLLFEVENITVEEVKKPEIVVYITGEVENPGLFTLEKGDRINTLVEKAGGVTGNANVSDLNMAKVLKDGDHIKVSAKSGKSGTGKINVNCKEVSTYCKVSGITTEIAENIIRYINENGYITNVDELRYVPGIDETLYNKIKNKFTI